MSLFRKTRVSAVFLLSAACAVAVACADSNEEPSDVQSADDAGEGAIEADAEASTQIPPAPDGGDDASDAEADALVFLDSGDDGGPKRNCTVHGWCHTELPPNQVLRAVWGDGTGIVWTVSEQGSILRWDGTTWSVVYNDPAGGALYTIWGSGPTDLWVGGKNGIFHGTGASSASITWTKPTSDATVPILSVWGSSATDVYAVGNNGTASQVLHYGGPPVDPATPEWVVHPLTSSLGLGKMSKVWGYSATNVWVVGSGPGGTANRYTKPFIFHLSPDDAGVPTFVKDESFTYYVNNALAGGYTADPNNMLWFGKYPNLPYMIWARKADGATTYTWKDAFAFSIPTTSASCGSQIHTGVLGFSISDVWKYGELGRLCHWDGNGWTLQAVSIEDLPLSSTFWDAWAPSGDASQMWVVGDNVAIRKRAPQP